MPDPKMPLATRRLNAVLLDEDYGPKLVRLNRADQRIVLDLIYDGKGREARKEIVSRDAKRRRRRTLREKARKYASKPRRQRSAEWREIMDEVENDEVEFWRLYRNATAS